ncbi:sensor histidine kinase [Paenibacillus dokdonensis]|uniref:Sensor histidine kinase n=1 Tax=Paenibacillus dokdonensis TaxID=2567944 RepID=A0ABU6GSZ7_9BACL|nr:sensor histidine kinase [Paenibacillus dokdonensis]MEC0242885.1 sensor histidine kinase [Paenibacillus dokdonensis]
MNIHSLRFKLIVYFLILICLPLGVVSFFSYKSSTAIIENKVTESVSANLSVLEESIESVLKESRYTVTPFLINFSYRQFLQRKINLSDYSDLTKINQIMNELNSIQISGHNIYSISLYNSRNRMLLTSERTMYFYPNNEVLHMEELAARESAEPHWFLENEAGFTYMTRKANYITYPILLDPTDSSSILFVHVSENTISDYIRKINSNEKGIKTLVLTGDGRSLSQTEGSGDTPFPPVLFGEKPAFLNELKQLHETEEGSFTAKVKKKELLVVFNTSQSTGFRYLAFVPREDWNKEIINLRKDIAIVAAIAVAGMLVLAFLFMRNIYNPMFRLLSAMKQFVVKRDFTYQIEEKRKDEFGVLFEGFNTMTENLQQLVKELYEEKLMKQEFELKLMQSKINPHFLYNTLNSIYSIAKIHGVREVTDMTYALSHFFRHSLKGDDWITVKEMLDHIQYYLRIQKIRYRDKFDVLIDVEDDLMDMPVLKLLLQPLVENAIIHGIEMKKGKGNITVSGYAMGEDVIFSVSDDGLGMDTERLNEVRNHLKSGAQSTDEIFALTNVDHRIKHYYGKAYGLQIYSQPNHGTTLEVILPKPGGGSHV